METFEQIALRESAATDLEFVGDFLPIRERIFINWGLRLETIRVKNGFNLDLGVEVFRSFLPPIDFEYLPAVGFMPLVEENINIYGNHSKFDLQIQVQGVEKHGTIAPGPMAELIYADIVEAIQGPVWSLGFDSGGIFKATVGKYIIGQTSKATGYIAGVSVTSGAWADQDAAGTLTLRRVTGDFIDDEPLDIGSNDDVATVDGAASARSALKTPGGPLIDAIDVLSAKPEFPTQGQLSTGVNIVFGVEYKRVAGNPYSQTN